jgi:hypothetical protein
VRALHARAAAPPLPPTQSHHASIPPPAPPQVGPFLCTPEGNLQKLMLGGAWLNCPAFPTAVGGFPQLHTMEFEVATFGGDTYANVAKARVRRGMG